MGKSFKVIGIYGRVNQPAIVDTLNTLIRFLVTEKRRVIIETETAKSLNDPSLPTANRDTLSNDIDLLIVVGGDGSFLHAMHAVVQDEVPVLGINRGRVGFLTDIHPTELNKIKDILDGRYTLEKRFLLDATVEQHGNILGAGTALNEVALIPDSLPHMSEFEIYINDQFVCSQDSDGLIVATPTGSTAYALSGGGPILHPNLNAMVIVPMFPHSLSMRPIVIEGDSVLSIIITPNNTKTPRLTCDSQHFVPTPPGSRITITKQKQPLHLIHPTDYDYYVSLRSKLHWGRKLHYSE